MTMLPRAGLADIDPRKISQYLLNPQHPDGAAKAKFFMAFGFTLDNPDALMHALLEHAQTHMAVILKTSAYGTTYGVKGPLRSPDGRDPNVRAIWIIPDQESAPRLVTVIPLKGRTP